MKNFKVKSIFLVMFCLLTTSISAQIFGKGNKGYVVLKDGSKLVGFVKSKAYTNKKLSSILFADKADGKYKTYKLKKDIIEYSLNGDSYLKASIKTSMFGGKKKVFCGIAYKGSIFTVINHPNDKFSKDGGLDIATMFFVRKKDSKDFKMITRLNYKKNMRKLCGDNADWKEAAKSPKWLSFNNRIENFKFYEEKLKQ